jgi:8-oxo-dGTP diphosphatase
VIHLATGIAVRDGRLLMVASRYLNHPQPLWNLPGGRQLPGELLAETVVREVFEETRLRADVGEVAYVSESYDGTKHFLNVAFRVILRPEMHAQDESSRNHIVEVAWVPLSQVADRIAVAVVREPLIAYLTGSLPQGYAGFHDAGVTIEWHADSQ